MTDDRISKNIQLVYSALKNEGYTDIGSEQDFAKKMQSAGNRKKVYDALNGAGYTDIGKDFDSFSGMVYSEPKQEGVSAPASKPSGGGIETNVAKPVVNTGGQQSQSRRQSQSRQQPAKPLPSSMDFRNYMQPAFQPAPIFEEEQSMDKDGNVVHRPKAVPTFKDGKMSSGYHDMVSGKYYDINDPSAESIVKNETHTSESFPDLAKVNRQQVGDMTATIDNYLKEVRGTAVGARAKKMEDAADKGFWSSLMNAAAQTAGQADPTDMQAAIRMKSQYGDGETPEEVERGKQIRQLEAAKRSMRDAQRVISEADHNAQEGSLGKWLESSFVGGALRGFGQKLFDADTWDMGVSDGADALGIMSALKKADKGEPLNKAEQMLLDAKAVELATNAYFGSYVGRGYKAGEVTAESLPFMLEMCINPASGAGHSAQAMLTRYALKRFGKEAVKRNTKKYVAAKVTSRVAGDLAGSMAMSATTGMARVGAGAVERMNGDVLADTDEQTGETSYGGHTEGESFGTALAKSFADTSIENYSEMVGEYFSPLTSLAGKYVSKGMNKIGLKSVNDFMENVAASDVAKMVGDFEKQAKWNGVFGEYAEEVAGNMMNAMVVGDMTMDTAEGTGVFNLDQNIDTFLGVGLMGGFMSGVKTLGYRTPKYRARKAMVEADDAASVKFADPDVWGDIRNTIAFGNEEEVKGKIASVLADDNLTDDQKRAALEYANKVETYRGILKGEDNRRAENPGSAEVDTETSYDNGYTLETDEEMNDAKNMYDFKRQQMSERVTDEELADFDNDPIVTLSEMMGRDDFSEDDKQLALDYVNAKATYDGMIDRVRDDMDSRIAASDKAVDSRVNKATGMITPATLKLDDRKVYIVDGTVNMHGDGSMVDVSNSSESILVRDAETGKLEFLSPHDVLSTDEAIDPAEEKEAAQQALREQYAQEQAERIDGVLAFKEGDTYDLTDEQGQQLSAQIVADNGDGTVQVAWNGDPNNVTTARKDELQSMRDNYNLARLNEYEQQRAAQRQEKQAETSAPQRRAYNLNDEITLRDEEGNPVRGSITAEENEDGEIEVYTEQPVNGKQVQMFRRDELDSLLFGQEEGDVPQEEGDVPQEEGDVPQEEPMPMVGEGEDAEPDFASVTPKRAHEYIFNESGLSEEDAKDFMANNLKDAQKAVDNISKKKPKMGTSIAKFNKDKAEWQKKLDDANARLDYWHQVKAERDAVLAERAKARQEADKKQKEEAQATEAAYREEMAKKEAEQAALGANTVSPAIRDKWSAAPKVEGAQNEIVLANGEKVAGRYYLVESGAATPSHNSANGFAKSEGFPVDENGGSVNDRDYERDKDAQQITRDIADKYDSRAMQTPVVVSQDGVVLSGNGRTMAGELAAAQGTDAEYNEHLAKYPTQYGFTTEQVKGMQHPRVVFVPDAAMPYTADTFAKFNQQEMKGQSKTEHSVKLDKVVDDETFNRIIRLINRYDTLGDFYADFAACREAIGELFNCGAISRAEMSEMMDGDGLSAIGKETLENMLIGKAFESNPDAVRKATEFKQMRQTVIQALAEVSNNIGLGEDYSLEEELAAAIDLVYNARKNGFKAGEPVSPYARQQQFDFYGMPSTVADYRNAAVMMLADILNDNRSTLLKRYMQLYNKNAKDAANGQLDLFSGDVASKESILNDINELLNYGTKEEQKRAVDEAVERRKSESLAEAGAVGHGSEGSSEGSREGTATGNGGNGLRNDGRGRAEGDSGKRQGNLAETEVTAPLSDEVNEFDKPFVISSSGTTYFGEIGAESGLTEAPIKLSLGENVKDENGANHGYGWLHIEAGHGDQIRAAGFASVEEFVETVARNYDTIREGSIIAGNQTYLLEVSDEHNNTLFIQLSRDGSYWNVNSAGIFKKKYSRRKPEVFTRPALEPGTNTDTSGVDSGQAKGVTTPAGNSPQTSDGKDNNNQPDLQGKGGKSAENSGVTSISSKIDAAPAVVNTEDFEKKNSASDNTTDTVGTAEGGKRNDTATPQNTVSEGKGTAKDSSDQENGEKSFKATTKEYTTKRDKEIDLGDIIPGLSRSDRNFLLDDGRMAYMLAGSEANPFVGFVGGSYKEEHFKLFREHYRDAVGDYIYKQHEKYLRDVFEFFEQTVGVKKDVEIQKEAQRKEEERALTDEEVVAITDVMKANATFAPTVEINDANWKESVDTPIGSVKMGGNQRAKLFAKGREQQYGMLLETLSNPDVVLEEKDKEQNMLHERPSSYLFVKTFQKEDGSTYVHFESVTVSQEGMEVSVSSHIIREKALEKKLKSSGIIYKNKTLFPNSSEMHLAEHQDSVPDLLPTQENNVSGGKDTEKDSSDQENGEKSFKITPKEYTTKRGKTLGMHLVTFESELSKEQMNAAKKLAKDAKGRWSKEDGGFLMRDMESAQRLAESVLDDADAVADAQPVSLKDMKEAAGDETSSTYKAGDVVSMNGIPFTVESVNEDGTLNLKGEQNHIGMVFSGIDTKRLDLDTQKNGDFDKKRKEYHDKFLSGLKKFKRNAESIKAINGAISEREKFIDQIKDMVENGDTSVQVGDKKGHYLPMENLAKCLGEIDAMREWLEGSKEQKPSKVHNAPIHNDEVQNHDWNQYKAGDVFDINGYKTTFKHVERDETGRVTGVAVQHLDENGKPIENGGESVPPLMFMNEYKKVESEPKESGNKLVTDERYAELKARMRKKLGQLNVGVDPEMLAIGTEMAVYHIEKGARKFTEYAKAMIEDLGEAIRPYLKAFYNGARDLPEVEENGWSEELTPYEEVRTIDIANFDKPSVDAMATAEMVVKEQKAEQQKDETLKKIADERNKKNKSVKKAEKKAKAKKMQEPTLFGDLNADTNENQDTESNEETNVQTRSSKEGGDGQQRQQDAQMGGSAGNEAERTDGRGMGGRGSRNTESDGTGSKGLSRPSESKQGVTPATPAEKKNVNNNHAERGKDYAPKSVDARIDANIKAIELMQKLMQEGKQATPAQMKVLRQFSGWGGLGKAFVEKDGWRDNPTAKRLKELLGDEAYAQAEMSRNSAYYTPASVIDTMWDIARALGFKGGKVLEGSAGIGNIIGAMPTDMSERSNIQAVEIDETTGNILSLLYPDAKVDVQGFEATRVPNGSVDLAITNVPFVTGLHVNDETGDTDLSKKFRDIHDFCIAKNVRKLREGGIGIFITSNGTLDSSQKLRNWLVNEGNADVVGAFRLNNQTFGGTGATSDIIVIRKRVNGKKSANAIDVSTVSAERAATFKDPKTGKERTVSMDYNKYFIEHPECMAGEMRFGFENKDSYRPTSKALYPEKGKNQDEMLAAWVKTFEGMKEDAASATVPASSEAVYEDLGEDVKEGSLVLDKDDKLCIAQYGKAVPLAVNANKVKGTTKAECFRRYRAIKGALADVLSYQTENESDDGLQPLLDKLNDAFDSFVKTYGHLHKNTSISFLKNDVDFPTILALEKYSEVGDKNGKKVEKYGKTDIFSQRVVEKEKAPEPKNVKDGIIASIYQYGRIDVPYIADKLGKSEEDVKKEIVKKGLGYENPVNMQMEVSYEYLSGNVREKLEQAEEANADGKYSANVEALRKVIPMDIPSHLIEFTLGSSWVDPKLYTDYIKERTDVDVQLTNVGGTWFMKTPYYTSYEKNKAMGVRGQEVQKLILGTDLIEAALQNKTITVSEKRTVGYGSSKTTETITDKEATQACSAKIDEIRADFKEWARQKMQNDAEMSERIERTYNEQFNNYVPLTISDEFVPEYFGGANHKFKMRPHQSKAIIRGTMQPLLLAHEVGTGKTFTLISTAMEMRRLGTAKKPMIVVQNATVGQFVASAKELYPNAKVLTLEEKDRDKEGRKNFYAKIKYNDWDMIVVPQSVFERIPDSEERQMRFIQDKIDEKMMVLEKMREAASDNVRNQIIRQAEKEIEKCKDEMGALAEVLADRRKQRDGKKEAVAKQNASVKAKEMLGRQTDDVEDFDDMGIDALLVDEAHEYKHLGFATAMQRGVKGIDPSFSKKSQGVYLKTQAVLEKNNGRNVIFATGTPISNTAAEIWTFMRYLMPADTMKAYSIYYFDDFVRNFGNLTQMLEFKTNAKFQEVNRFAGYVNLPELVRIWSSVADTVRTDEAKAVKDNVPDIEGGQAQDIYLPQTRALRSIMKFVKEQLNEYDKMSGKEKKENSHIPLTMYGIAKAAAVDARLVMADAEDDKNSKTNEAVRQTLRSLKETAKYNGTIALFADNYQNKHSGFNLYEDIRKKLIEQGVPAEQVVIIRSGMSIKKKQEIFDKVNRGEIRVIMGSTFTLGTGVNIQERLHTLIHLDAPNRPMDYTQRNGRIVRQGNLHKGMGIPIRILRFGVQDSLDVTAYQRLKTKGAIADSIMKSKAMMQNSMEDRSMEEDEDVFGDTVAQLSGSQYAMLKNQAEREVRKYESKKKQWEADQTYVHNAIPRISREIERAEERAATAQQQLDAVAEAFGGNATPVIKVGKKTYADINAMSALFADLNKKVNETAEEMRKSGGEDMRTRKVDVQIGDVTFTITTTQTKELVNHYGAVDTKISRSITYSCPELGLENEKGGAWFKNAIEDIFENVVSGDSFREELTRNTNLAERMKGELEQVKSREGQPFQYDKELAEAYERLEEYTELMKQELEEKEQKYAEMDSEVETATGVTEADEADEDEDSDMYRMDDEELEKNERQREQTSFEDGQVLPIEYDWKNEGYKVEGLNATFANKDRLLDAFRNKYESYVATMTSDGNSIEVSPWRNVLAEAKKPRRRNGKPTKEEKAKAAFIERKTRRAVESVSDVARKLGLDVEVKTDTEGLTGRRARAKGWYDTKSGKIVIILPNHTSGQDVMRTILHEGVAHYGLRKLFGKDFDTFLENVYDNASKEIREAINRLAAKNGWDFRVATEEYLAGMAEDTNFERAGYQNWWSKIKFLFLDMLRKAGLVLDRTLTDADLRYILWRSYENLKEPGRYRSILGEAEDISKQMDLKVGNFAPMEAEDSGRVAERRVGEQVNERFNEQLAMLTERNADRVVFSLGRPSAVLRAAGVKNKPMKLYGNKVMKKMRKHGFALEELCDLPRAVADPIAVFNNYGEDGNRSILTELRTSNGNFLVTISLGKGTEDIDFNIISSVFGKGEDNIVDWLNRGLATYINKEKASDYLHHSALRAVTSESPRLNSAAKIVENFENPKVSDENFADDGILYRDGDPMDERDRAIVRDRYERTIQSGMYQFREAVQDSMLSLRRLMEHIAEATGEKIKEFENAYIAENALSSKNHAEQDIYGKLLFNPMLDEIHRLAKEGSSRDEVTRYMMAKHGLERNEVMARRAAEQKAKEELGKDLRAAERAVQNDPLDQDALDALDDVKQRMQDRVDELYKENRERDYGGITGLMGEDDLATAESSAKQFVDAFEGNHDVGELWVRVNACTKATLEKTYKSGLLSKSGFEEINSMYEHYIPLRGFDATTSDEVYSYLTHEKSGFSSPLKKAEGRKSVADDPIATIANMADCAIVQGNRNLMKQKFLKFVMNHPSDAVSVNKMWLRYDDVKGEWEAVTANIDENDSADDVVAKTEAFEEQMRQLAESAPDHYKRGKDAVGIPYKTLGKNLNEHQVHVKMGGEDYILTINGSPRVAQALNGLTNPDNENTGAVGAVLKMGEYVNRQMSAFYTTRNPEFVLSNFLRDAMYANSTMWVRETPNYAIKFNKNFLKCNPAMLYKLLQKHNSGTLDMDNETERAFHQFMMNGGETGYTVVKDIEKQKKLIKKYVRMKDASIPAEAAWKFLGDKLDDINRSVENCARFAAYLTSRQMGRSVERSVWDAKEVSVNFNKKGAGSTFLGKTGETKLGNSGAFASGIGRSFYVFWNAAVQGTTNFASLHKHHTAKALAMDASLFLLGAILAGIGGGDDDDYWNLPSYVRRSNICFKIPGTESFCSIPLGIEQRAIYGLGELFSSLGSGRERMSGKEIAKEIAGSMSSMLPLDLMESNGDMSWSTVSPSYVKPFVENANNKNWKGMPIYRKTPYNEDDPEWTKASKRTNQLVVDFSKWCNEVTGGDEVKRGWANWNPSKLEHLFEGVFGGISTTANKMVKAGEMVAGKQDFDWSNILIASRVVKSGDEDAAAKRYNAEYWKYYGKYRETKRLVDHYENQDSEGIIGAAEKLDFMYNSPEYGRYEIVDEYYSEVKELSDELQETTDNDERKELEAEINTLKQEMVMRIRAYDDARKK